MPSTTEFFPLSIDTSGVIVPPDSDWINTDYLTDLSGSKTRTQIQLIPNAESNSIIIKNFNSEIPFGSRFTGIKLNGFVSLDSVGDTQNVRATEVYIQYNGNDYGNNLATYGFLQDWGYSNVDFISDPDDLPFLNESIVTDPSFGVRIKIKNDNQSEYYYAYIDKVSLILNYEFEHPRFYYNGDTTSEVNVTLDLNPEVTNPTTTFSVFRGDPDTTSSGSDAGYLWGPYYSEPNVNDPTDHGYVEYVYSPGYGSYVNNYLITDTSSSNISDHSLTNHIMSYDVSGLIEGEIYTRELVLWNIRFPIGKIYDTLTFNLTIIDTSPPPVDITGRIRNTGTYSNFII